MSVTPELVRLRSFTSRDIYREFAAHPDPILNLASDHIGALIDLAQHRLEKIASIEVALDAAEVADFRVAGLKARIATLEEENALLEDLRVENELALHGISNQLETTLEALAEANAEIALRDIAEANVRGLAPEQKAAHQ